MKHLIPLLFFLFPLQLMAQTPPTGVVYQAALTWTEPTQNEDGSPLTDLASYRIYRTATSGVYADPPIATVLAPATSYTDAPLGEGTWFYVMTAVDTSGNESVWSNEASKTIAIPPAAPLNLQATSAP